MTFKVRFIIIIYYYFDLSDLDSNMIGNEGGIEYHEEPIEYHDQECYENASITFPFGITTHVGTILKHSPNGRFPSGRCRIGPHCPIGSLNSSLKSYELDKHRVSSLFKIPTLRFAAPT